MAVPNSQDERKIPGTYPYTGERSRQGYRINKLSMSLTDPANRKRFLENEDGYMRGMGLTEAERAMVAKRDWASIIKYGGNIYLILKIAGTIGQTLLQMGAQMRDETLGDFMKTRPGPERAVRHSIAGKERR